MSKYKLEKYSVKELQQIIKAAERLIKKNEAAEKAKLKKELAALAAKKGYSIEELMGGSPKVKTPAKPKAKAPRRKVAPKYRDPKSGQTWTGRGRKPKWVADIIEAGGKIEDYTI